MNRYNFKIIEDKWFKRHVLNLLMDEDGPMFLSKDISMTTFIGLFEGKYLENKINWIDNKSSLIYFIKLPILVVG